MRDRAHLRRLSDVWIKNPVYFVTTATFHRRAILINNEVPEILIESWVNSPQINGWVVGRFVIMPDHVHFFVRPRPGAKSLSEFMRDWKRWTAQRILRLSNLPPPVWQPEFFDHMLRSADSYSEKWHYVEENPVRAGLVTCAADWPHAGECERLDF